MRRLPIIAIAGLIALAATGCNSSLRRPVILVKEGAIIHLLNDTPTTDPAVENDAGVPEVVPGQLVVPSGYVCVPPQAID